MAFAWAPPPTTTMAFAWTPSEAGVGGKDVIIAVSDTQTQQIVLGEVKYQLLPFQLPTPVERIWYYTSLGLFSNITYVAEIEPGILRSSSGDGHSQEYAYFIRTIYRLRSPLTHGILGARYGVTKAPRDMEYVPEMMLEEVDWRADDSERVVDRSGLGSLVGLIRSRSGDEMDVDMVGKRCADDDEGKLQTTKRRR